MITVNEDLTVNIVKEDSTFCNLPNYNPETLTKWGSAAEAQRYAESILGNSKFFQTPKPTTYRTTLSPVELKMQFTAQERVAIKQAAEEDPIIEDFLEVLNDPRLKDVDLKLQENIDAMTYLTGKSTLAAGRSEKILMGLEIK